MSDDNKSIEFDNDELDRATILDIENKLLALDAIKKRAEFSVSRDKVFDELANEIIFNGIKERIYSDMDSAAREKRADDMNARMNHALMLGK